MLSTAATAIRAIIVQVRVEIVVEREKEGLGVTDEKEVEADNWQHDRGKEHRQLKMAIPLEIKIKRDTDEAANPVVNRPDRKKEISGLALVGIATARATIQRRKVVPQRTNL